MQDAIVKLKDGTEFCSPLWEFNPKKGFLRLVDGEPIRLKDIESATNKNQWIHWDTIKDVDLLERARQEGWNGT